MKFTGTCKQDTNLQIKALREVSNFLDILRNKNPKRLYRITQRSWKKKGLWKKKHQVSDIVFPVFDMYELIEIELHSKVMIEAKIRLTSHNNTEIRTIRFLAEKGRNKTHSDSKFRINPTSIMSSENFETP